MIISKFTPHPDLPCDVTKAELELMEQARSDDAKEWHGAEHAQDNDPEDWWLTDHPETL